MPSLNERRLKGRVIAANSIEQHIIDFEQFMLGTTLRGAAALEAFNDRPPAQTKPLWHGDADKVYRWLRRLVDDSTEYRLEWVNWNSNSETPRLQPKPWSLEDERVFHPNAKSVPNTY